MGLLRIELDLAGVATIAQLGETCVERSVEEDRVLVLGQLGGDLLLHRVALVVGVGGLRHPERVHGPGEQAAAALPSLEDVRDGGRLAVARDLVELEEVGAHPLLDRLAEVRIGEVGVVGKGEWKGRRAQQRVGHDAIKANDVRRRRGTRVGGCRVPDLAR